MSYGSTAFSIGVLWGLWSNNQNEKCEKEEAETLQNDKSVAGLFKRSGWESFYDINKFYEGNSIAQIKKKYEFALSLKNMPADERVGKVGSGETHILEFVNNNSYAQIKKIRDTALMECSLYLAYKKEIAHEYGEMILETREVVKEDGEDYGRHWLLVLFVISLFAIAFTVAAKQ